MKKIFALGLAGALAAGTALLAAPPAQAQVGISVGFGSGWGYGYDYGYSPGLFGVGVGPVGYYGGYGPAYGTPYYGGAPAYYDEPVYQVVRRPVRRVVVNYGPSYRYAPRSVVRTRVVTRAPRYVTRVVTASPEVRRTRVIQRRVYY